MNVLVPIGLTWYWYNFGFYRKSFSNLNCKKKITYKSLTLVLIFILRNINRLIAPSSITSNQKLESSKIKFFAGQNFEICMLQTFFSLFCSKAVYMALKQFHLKVWPSPEVEFRVLGEHMHTEFQSNISKIVLAVIFVYAELQFMLLQCTVGQYLALFH